jgi:hypothetical protein
MVATYRKFTMAALTGAALIFALAGVAAAHSGSVVASETCSTWSVTVSLANNTTPDRTVVVTTTIPGTVGIAGNHYNTSFGQIWSASGAAPATGTVTLKIYNGSSVEFTTSASIAPAKGCATPTPFQSFQGENSTPIVTATPFKSATPTLEITAPPTARPTDPADPTPFQSFQGETATPSSSPFQSFQGETATPVHGGTPPPTSTGDGSSSGGSTPLFAVLICLAFAGLGLAAVEAQRRSVTR